MPTRWRAVYCLILSLTVAVAGRAALAQDSLPGPGAGQETTFEQDVSYAIGLSMGRDLLGNGAPVDAEQVAAGLLDALRKAKPRLTDKQVTAVLTRFDQLMQQKVEKQMASVSEQNKQKGADFLAANAKKDGVVTTDSGLQYKVVKEGTGAAPTAASTVSCHYEGTLINGEVFDSSYKRGQPAQFPVNGVISGWTEMLQLMKEGGEVQVFIASDLAYGERGAPPVIGPGETLIFKIELLKIVQ